MDIHRGEVILWLLLCYAQCARSNLYDDGYMDIVNKYLVPRSAQTELLPVELGVDPTSGCMCRASQDRTLIVCFGNYLCKKFPKVMVPSEVLRVRTSVITEVVAGDLDNLGHLKALEIEANHKLIHLESGIFRNLSRLERLSISYNTLLSYLKEDIFEGLISLRNLTLVNNGWHNILKLTPAFRPIILPSLQRLDLSENSLEDIPENAFVPMDGTSLKKLVIHLCSIDFIHPNSLLPLKMLRELNLGENELNSSSIGNLLKQTRNGNINLTHLDLKGMGFRKQIPRDLLDIISKTTINTLTLANNQFEIIPDDAFPKMINIEVLDLRHILATFIGPNAFNPMKFPNLKVLLLSGNNLPGMHYHHVANQLIYLDLSCNKGSSDNPMYFDIDKDNFLQSRDLKILNLSYDIIKSIFDYSFRGLENLKNLNLENATLYRIGDGTFKPLKKLEVLNLANNPLRSSQNLTCSQFEGLNELKVLVMSNCGIKNFSEDDNIFETMPNLTHLMLRNNQLYYITAEILKPLKFLEVLDLSENLLVSWWKPLFISAGVKPYKLYLGNNKISHFSLSMVQDISYLLENKGNNSAEIDLMDNVFVCDCSTMFKTYLWLEVNGSQAVKEYFANSQFQCSSPDIWEDRRVADYLSSIKRLHCLVYQKISTVMILVWSAPTLVTAALILIVLTLLYRYRVYIRYWIFLAKLALGRKFIRKSLKTETVRKEYKYDAFVSYCNEDREFVLDMIYNLEEKPPYLKLCLYERDFIIGSFISESVVSCINNSKYIVLLVSNSFAKSQWCRWETQLAEYHRLFLEDGTTHDPLVLIKLTEVESKYLTATLKYLLKTKIYLSWDEQNSNDFWKKLKDALSR